MCCDNAAAIALDSSAGRPQTSASAKHSHSLCGGAARAPIQQACDLPVQRGGSGGQDNSETCGWRAAMARTIAAVSSAEWSSITSTLKRAAG
jgi:hypothetical protein